jgi:O-antigen ligase
MPKWLSPAACLLIFILPLSSNSIEHSTSIISMLLVLLGIYAWLSNQTGGPILARDEKRIMWTFAAYFGVSLFFYLAYGLFSEHHSLKWRLDHQARFLTFIPIYYLCTRINLKPWVLWYGAAAAAIAYGIYSPISLYLISPVERVTGAYHAIAFGTVSVTMGFISLAGIRYFLRHGSRRTAIPILAASGGILAGFLSGTRATVIVIPFMVLIFFIQLKNFRRPWMLRAILLLLLVVMAAASYHLPGSTMRHRIHTGLNDAGAMLKGDHSGEYAVHLVMWREGWKIFKDHPFTGVGARGYDRIIKEKAEKGAVPARIAQMPSPHNMYLNDMAAYGVTGLIVLLAVFLMPLTILGPAARRTGPNQDVAYAGIMLIVAFMLFAMTESIFIRNININVYLIMTAAILSLVRHHREDAPLSGG